MTEKPIILGIETSCDETAVSLIQDIENDVVPIDEPFILPDGTAMMYPGKGPIKHTANCKCFVTAAPRSRVREEDRKRGIDTAQADAQAMFGRD